MLRASLSRSCKNRSESVNFTNSSIFSPSLTTLSQKPLKKDLLIQHQRHNSGVSSRSRVVKTQKRRSIRKSRTFSESSEEESEISQESSEENYKEEGKTNHRYSNQNPLQSSSDESQTSYEGSQNESYEALVVPRLRKSMILMKTCFWIGMK